MALPLLHDGTGHCGGDTVTTRGAERRGGVTVSPGWEVVVQSLVPPRKYLLCDLYHAGIPKQGVVLMVIVFRGRLVAKEWDFAGGWLMAEK